MKKSNLIKNTKKTILKITNNLFVSLSSFMKTDMRWGFELMAAAYWMMQIMTMTYFSLYNCPNVNLVFDQLIMLSNSNN